MTTTAGMFNPIEFFGYCIFCRDPNFYVYVRYWRDESKGVDQYVMSKCSKCKQEGTFAQAPKEWEAVIRDIEMKRIQSYTQQHLTREDLTNVIMNTKYHIQDDEQLATELTEKEKHLIVILCQYLYFSLAKSGEEIKSDNNYVIERRVREQYGVHEKDPKKEEQELLKIKQKHLPKQKYYLSKEELQQAFSFLPDNKKSIEG